MDEERASGQTQTEKGSIHRVEAKTGNLEGV